MIGYYFVLDVKETPQDRILVQSTPDRKYVDKLELIREYLTEYSEFYVLREDKRDGIYELCSDESYSGYPVNTTQAFTEISHLLDKVFVCRINDYDEKVTVVVYDIQKNAEQIDKEEGVEGARGYDAIKEIENRHDLSINWDWDELENSIPTAINI